MPRALYQGTVIAESNETIFLEGNHYFPPQAVKQEYLVPSSYKTICPWKGEASYYHVQVGDKRSENAAWSYLHPKEAAKHIAGYIAFWKDVTVKE